MGFHASKQSCETLKKLGGSSIEHFCIYLLRFSFCFWCLSKMSRVRAFPLMRWVLIEECNRECTKEKDLSINIYETKFRAKFNIQRKKKACVLRKPILESYLGEWPLLIVSTDWLILMTFQAVWDYLEPRGLGIAYIVQLYLHFCGVF